MWFCRASGIKCMTLWHALIIMKSSLTEETIRREHTRRTYKKKNKKGHRDTASQFTMLKLLKNPSAGIVTEHPTLYKCNQTLVLLLSFGF